LGGVITCSEGFSYFKRGFLIIYFRILVRLFISGVHLCNLPAFKFSYFATSGNLGFRHVLQLGQQVLTFQA